MQPACLDLPVCGGSTGVVLVASGSCHTGGDGRGRPATGGEQAGTGPRAAARTQPPPGAAAARSRPALLPAGGAQGGVFAPRQGGIRPAPAPPAVLPACVGAHPGARAGTHGPRCAGRSARPRRRRWGAGAGAGRRGRSHERQRANVARCRCCCAGHPRGGARTRPRRQGRGSGRPRTGCNRAGRSSTQSGDETPKRTLNRTFWGVPINSRSARWRVRGPAASPGAARPPALRSGVGQSAQARLQVRRCVCMCSAGLRSVRAPELSG
jgi:hypothetical protein